MGKIGKTTFGSQMPGALLLAFEKGYNAIPNIYPQDVSTWSEMKQILRQLKRPEVKEQFQSIIVDTIDIAAPPSPRTSIVDAIIIFLFFPKSILFSIKTFRPFTAMKP